MMARIALITSLVWLVSTQALGAGLGLGIDLGIGLGGGSGSGSSAIVPDWEAFKAQFNKAYADAAEEAKRMAVYLEKVVEINAHNADPTKTYKKGINFFSDVTFEEFRAYYTGAVIPANETAPRGALYTKTISTRQAADVDWRNNGAVTPVKDQGSCGSCWAFSTTGAIEGAYFINNGQLISQSEEFLNDCDTTNGGCSGGWPYKAMTFVQNYGGIPTETQYPYTAGNGQNSPCQNPTGSNLSGVMVTGQANNGGSESTLQTMVANEGPVSVCVDAADGCNWQSYSSGIFNEPGCYQVTDHCVLAVGYSAGNYWILKNQWGTGWGESGYIRLAWGSNMCGIADYGYIPYVN